MVLGEGGVQGYSTRPTHSSSQPPPRTQSARTLDPETDPAFARLLAELRQTIASPAFAHVLEKCLDRAADIFFENVKGNLFTASADPSAASEPEKIRLASLLPGLARWSHLALNAVPNELVDVRHTIVFLCLSLAEREALAGYYGSQRDDSFRSYNLLAI